MSHILEVMIHTCLNKDPLLNLPPPPLPPREASSDTRGDGSPRPQSGCRWPPLHPCLGPEQAGLWGCDRKCLLPPHTPAPRMTDQHYHCERRGGAGEVLWLRSVKKCSFKEGQMGGWAWAAREASAHFYLTGHSGLLRKKPREFRLENPSPASCYFAPLYMLKKSKEKEMMDSPAHSYTPDNFHCCCFPAIQTHLQYSPSVLEVNLFKSCK